MVEYCNKEEEIFVDNSWKQCVIAQFSTQSPMNFIVNRRLAYTHSVAQ